MDLAQLQALASASGGGNVGSALLSFRAGLSNLANETVTSDPRKGQIELITEDQLLHFKWKLRPHDMVEEDLIIMPGDAKVEKVPECTDGRVFFITFASQPSRRIFFWLQEPTTDNDEQIYTSMNEYFSGTKTTPTVLGKMETEPVPTTAPTGSGPTSTVNASDLQMDQNQLLQLLQTHLQQGGLPNANQTMTQMAQAQQSNSLNAVLDPELITPLLEDEDLVQALVPHLPEGQQSKQDLAEQLRSPQLQQTLTRLTIALNSGQAGPLVAQLGLDATTEIGVDALVKALKEQAEKTKLTKIINKERER